MTNQILFNHVNKIAAYGCMFKAGGAFASRYQEHKILGQLAKCYAMCFHGEYARFSRQILHGLHT